MSKFFGSHWHSGHPPERSTRRRSRWFLAGGLAAGTLVVGAAGFTGVTASTADGDPANSASGSLPALVASNDEDGGTGEGGDLFIRLGGFTNQVDVEKETVTFLDAVEAFAAECPGDSGVRRSLES